MAEPRKCFGPKGPKWDDTNGAWTLFPNGKLYLLPVLSRETKLAPVFNEDDEVSLEVQHADDELSGLVDKFLSMLRGHSRSILTGDVIPTINGRGHLALTPERYAEFIGLVKQLLGRNYAFSNGELGSILSLTRPQLGHLVDVIVGHLTKGE